MTITARMSLTLTGAGLLLFGSFGAWLLHVEQQDLRHVAERELRLLARSLQGSIGHALRDRQPADIHETLASLEKVESTVDTMVYDQGMQRVAASAGAVAATPLELAELQLAMSSGERHTIWDGGDPPERLAIALPLRDGTMTSGGILVVRPLHDMNIDLATTRRGITFAVAVFVIAASALGFWLGTTLLGRPLRVLAATMDRVRAGHLDLAAGAAREDEIGDIVSHFNGMVDELARARRKSAEDGEARRRMQRSLEEASKLITVGQLSAGLAHEIGSPLQVLEGRAQMLAEMAEKPHDVRRVAKIIVEQSQRITRVVSQLLEFARRRPQGRHSGDPVEAVAQVVELLKGEAHRKQVSLVGGPAVVLPAYDDLDALQQIALNLLANALHATPKGGQVLIALGSDSLPDTALDRTVAAITVTVTDTGMGMTDEVRARLFEPFFTTRADQGGTGLGLAVVGALVSERRGRVDVIAESSGGTTMRVVLPQKLDDMVTGGPA